MDLHGPLVPQDTAVEPKAMGGMIGDLISEKNMAARRDRGSGGKGIVLAKLGHPHNGLAHTGASWEKQECSSHC